LQVVDALQGGEETLGGFFFTPLYHHLELQSEKRGGLILDHFDALNPPVTSICPWERWLLRYKQKRSQFLKVKNSGSIDSWENSRFTPHIFRFTLAKFEISEIPLTHIAISLDDQL
jgi:hypothetical protein